MFGSGKDVVCTEKTWGGDTKITYADGSVGIESKTLGGETKTVISKNGEEIATALSKDTAGGTQSITTTYKDGSSGHTIHSPNALLGPENSTHRDGKSTNENYHSAAVHHDAENKVSNTKETNSNNSYTEKSSGSNVHGYNYGNSTNNQNKTHNQEVPFIRAKTQAEIEYEKKVKEGIDRVSNTEKEHKLRSIVYTKKYPEVQLAAIRKLDSKGVGFSSIPIVLLRGEYDDRVRYEIFKNTRNIPIKGMYDSIEYIIKYDPSQKIRLAAIDRLTRDRNKYQEIINSTLRREKDTEILLKAISLIEMPSPEEYTKDKYILKDLEDIAIGRTSTDIEVRKKALEKIIHGNDSYIIGMMNAGMENRKRNCQKMINEDMLYTIAKNHNQTLSILAINGITNQRYLDDLRKSSIHKSVREIAKQKSGHQSLFVKMMFKIFS